MAKLMTSHLKKYIWEYSNDWDFLFEGLDDFFDGWIPATSVELGFYGVTTEALGSSGVEYPVGNTKPTLTISYIDTEELVVTRFFTEWFASTVSQDGYEVQLPTDAAKEFKVRKLLTTNKTKYIWTGKVIPSGSITYAGDTDASVPAYQVSFVVIQGSMTFGT